MTALEAFEACEKVVLKEADECESLMRSADFNCIGEYRVSVRKLMKAYREIRALKEKETKGE